MVGLLWYNAPSDDILGNEIEAVTYAHDGVGILLHGSCHPRDERVPCAVFQHGFIMAYLAKDAQPATPDMAGDYGNGHLDYPSDGLWVGRHVRKLARGIS